MPKLSAQGLGFGSGEPSGESQQLEPADQIGGEAVTAKPAWLEPPGGRRASPESGVLQPADVVLDAGMGPHVHIEIHRVAFGVGVVAQ